MMIGYLKACFIFYSYHEPAILFNHFYDIFDFHGL